MHGTGVVIGGMLAFHEPTLAWATTSIVVLPGIGLVVNVRDLALISRFVRV